MQQQKITLGRFGAVYGVRGWIKVISYTEPPEKILDFPTWLIHHRDIWEKVDIEDSKLHSGKILVKLSEYHDRDLVRRFTNDTIAVEQSALPPLSKEEYYWSDLIGLQVLTSEGISLGNIDQMMATGSNDVMVVMGERKRLIPYIKSVVRSIDLEKRIVTVDWDPDY